MAEVQITDAVLMREVAGGRRAALEKLVRRHAAGLLTFIERTVGDKHRSEDLFQDTFLAVWAKRTQYTYPRPFKPWLYAIALNRCRVHFRTAVSPPLRLLDEHLAASAEPSAEQVVIATETACTVSSAVAELPESQRVVIVLRIWNGMTYGEIAEIVGRTEATVRSNMHHALKHLRAHLEPRLK